jgi:hypothetical protein
MNFGILQFVFAKTDTDFSQIIFIVVIAAFWILGAIVKVVSSKAKKTENLAEKQDIAKQPSRPIQFQTKQKAPVRARLAEKLKKTYFDRISKKQPVREIKAVLPEKPELSISMPSIKTGLEDVIEIEKKKATEPALAESLLSFESADDLKKGILYYEILGKPLSLRQEERLF